MARFKKPADACRSIIVKQLRFIDKKDPKDVTPADINLVLDYYKTLPKEESNSSTALSEISTEDLLKAVSED